MKGKTLLVAFALYFVSYILIVNLNHIGIWKYSQQNIFSRYNLDTMRDAKIKKFYKEINRLLHLKESTPVEDEKLSDIEVLKSGNITHALCDVYNHDANRKRITVTSLWKEYLDVDYQDITMVLQLTVDRINLLSVHASHWIGPMSVTIYIKRKHLLDLGSILSTMDPVLQRNNIDLHIVLKEGIFHPVNYLRNIAIDNAETKFVLYNDGDFITNKEAHERIKAHIAKEALKERQVLVLPALESVSRRKEIPEDLATAKRLVGEGKLVNFHQQVVNGRTFAPGHAATNLSHWSRTNNSYYVEWTSMYEPYIVGVKDRLPAYNTSLVGRGLNKLAHILNINTLGFRFLVLPDVFLVHIPHKKNYSAEYKWISYRCSDHIYQSIYQDLKRKHPANMRKQKNDLYIFREGGKRLGNQLYWFASTYGIARHHARKNLWGLKMKQHLFELFPGIESHMEFQAEVNWPELPTKRINYDPNVMSSLPETNLTLRWYTHSYRYFNHCSDELYHQMLLRKSLVLKARNFIKKCKISFVDKFSKMDIKKISVVGIHIRRGDKLKPEYQGPNQGYRIPEASEILYAMNYMRLKHNHSVIFIIATDDKSWCRDNIATQPDTFLTPFTSPYDDFSSLASADHLIMTQSSFAWWAAWLLEQRVLHTSNYTKHPDILYNKHPFINNTRLWRDYRRVNLYPEHWIGYTNHSVDTQKEILCTSTNVTSCFKY